MLSVPTLWIVIVLNFLALGLLWIYVQRAYPKFEAASYWAAAALFAAAGAALSMLRNFMEPTLPLILGASLMVLACCLGAQGIQRFCDQRPSWHLPVLVTGVAGAALFVFFDLYDNMAMRIAVYSLAQAIPIAMTLKLVLGRPNVTTNPGAVLAGRIAIIMLAVLAIRTVCGLLQIGGPLMLVTFNNVQAFLLLLLVFMSMAWNFAFLLMAVDRLRNEVADLALLDDLTGVGNRRHLMQRLTEECARSERSGHAFAVLVIDLDGFKGINDSYGHAAGDACLQHFTLMAQTRLRPGDMLARSGGDEFCIVLPASGLREGATIARRVLQVCREDAAASAGADISIAVSIGVAEWTREIGAFPERLIANADAALYLAKNAGKNRYALHDGAPTLAPELEALVFDKTRGMAAG